MTQNGKLRVFIFCIALLFCINLAAQDTTAVVDDSAGVKPKWGLYVLYGYNTYTADFRMLPGIPSCCVKYKDGDGEGISFGALYETPIYDKLWLGIRLGMSNLNGTFNSKEASSVILNNKVVPGIFAHILDARISTLDIGANVLYNFFDNFNVSLGAKGSLLMTKDYKQREEIVEPKDAGVFEDNGLRVRNKTRGGINDASSVQMFLNAGISYEFALNKRKWLFLAPEINYSLGLTNLVSGIDWKVSTIRGGFSLKYQTPPPPPPPPPAPLPPPFAKYPVPEVPPTISVAMNVVQIDSTNQESQNIKLKIEDFISLNMRPLLNYVFFDSCSAKIPARYHMLKPDEIDTFAIEKLKSLDVLPTYYEVLNIIGKRLKENSSDKISIVGTNCNTDGEKNNKDLSKARAYAVRDYLRDVWKVDERRMSVEYRNLPKEASNSEEQGGDEENRRVEIISKNPEITEPVITMDTLRKINESTIRFLPKATAAAGISSWEIDARQNNQNLFTYKGNGNVADKVDWKIIEKGENTPKKSGIIDYTFTATDKLGQSATTDVANIKVDQLTIDKKRIEGIADKEYEYYSLILFDYGKSTLGTEHKKVADFVSHRITKESNVTITGYTDAMGGEDINKRISEKRAEEFAKRLRLKNAKISGVGESQLLYDNKLPEGRFYCRTVKITIETPVKHEN